MFVKFCETKASVFLACPVHQLIHYNGGFVASDTGGVYLYKPLLYSSIDFILLNLCEFPFGMDGGGAEGSKKKKAG